MLIWSSGIFPVESQLWILNTDNFENVLHTMSWSSFIKLTSRWQTTATISGAGEPTTCQPALLSHTPLFLSLTFSVVAVFACLRWMQPSLLDSIALLSDDQECTVVAVCAAAPDSRSSLPRTIAQKLFCLTWRPCDGAPLGLVIQSIKGVGIGPSPQTARLSEPHWLSVSACPLIVCEFD